MGDLVDLAVERSRRLDRRVRRPTRCPECGGAEDGENELLESGLTWGQRLGLELEAEEAPGPASVDEAETTLAGDPEDHDEHTAGPRGHLSPLAWRAGGDDDIPF